jgi:hypothetical protein
MRWKANLRTFRWLALALFVGATLATTQLLWTSDLRNPNSRSISTKQFKQAVSSRMRNVTVYPPTRSADGVRLQYVTREILDRRSGTSGDWKPFTFYAPVPFSTFSDATAQDYLKTHSSEALYRYAWWETPAVVLALWLGAAVLIIAGALPGLIGIVRAITEPQCASAPDQPSYRPAADQTMDVLMDSQEPIEMPAPPADRPTSCENMVKFLPAESPTTPPVDAPDEPKEYTGEYYPVAHPHAKQDKAV